MKLYANYFSQPSAAVIQFLKENSIDFELVLLDLGKLEHKKSEFLKINPQGQVPTLEDDGFALSESGAILIYLHEKFKTKDHWYPADIKKRAKVNQWLHWHHTHTRKAGVEIVFNSVWAPLIFKKPPEAFKAAVEEGKKVLKASLDILEIPLKQSKFLVGDEISIADLIIAHELFAIAVHKLYDWTSSHPSVAKWLDTVKNSGKFSEVSKQTEEFAKKHSQ
jgi:glutathione S-transferase